MTQTTYFLTNGNSLEDCHTNFFALADLCGIKWRQYSYDKNFNDLNDDPILSSFSRCINANLLCVWRRIRNTNSSLSTNTQDNNNTNPHHQYRDQNYYTKELWIFWYGDEPDLKDLVTQNLKEGEQGSWESGLSYECRTLLFKALHNLIERCLLSKGYSRIGRWFFQTKNRPQCHKETAAATNDTTTMSDILKEGTQITFRFNFFLHGDSSVCANVDVRQHSSIRSITRDDLHMAQQIPDGMQVLLSPYGVQGYLTGYVYKDNDPNVQKFLSDWNKIYPLSSSNMNNPSSSMNSSSSANNNNNNTNNQQKSAKDKSIPNSNDNDHIGLDLSQKVVEIIVDNCRLKYPANYVFVTDVDAQIFRKKVSLQSPSSPNSNSCPSSQLMMQKTKNLFEFSIQTQKESDEHLEQMKLIMTPYCNQQPNDSYYLRKSYNRISNICDQNENDKKNVTTTVDDDEILLRRNCNCPKCSISQRRNSSKFLSSSNSATNLSSSSSSLYCSSSGKNMGKDMKKWSSSSSLLKNLSSINSTPFHHRTTNKIDLNNQFNILPTKIDCSKSSSNNNNNNNEEMSNQSNNGISHSTQSSSSLYKNTPGNAVGGTGSTTSTCVDQSSNSSFVQQQQQQSVQDHHNSQSNHMQIDSANNPMDSQRSQQQQHQTASQSLLPPPPPPPIMKEESALASLIAASTPILNNNNNQMIHLSSPTGITSKDSNNNHNDNVMNESNNIQSDNNERNGHNNNNNNKRNKCSSFYDDDLTYRLRNGLLYDFSDETLLNEWDLEMAQKNRRFKSNHTIYRNNDDESNNHQKDDQNHHMNNNNNHYQNKLFDQQNDDKTNNLATSTPMINRLLNSSTMNCINSSEILRSNLSAPNTGANGIGGGGGAISPLTNGGILPPSFDHNNLNNNNNNNGSQFSTLKSKLSPTDTEMIKNTVMNCHSLNGGGIGEKLVVNHNGNLFVKNGEILPSDLEFLNSPLEDEQQQQQQSLNSQVNHHPKNNMNSMDVDMTTTTTSNGSTAVLGVAELSRMFPTPPSLEAMVSSPSNSYVTEVATVKSINDKNCNESDIDSIANNHISHQNNNRMETQSSSTSSSAITALVPHSSTLTPLNDSESKELALVYMPPVQSVFITSDKYAPLGNVECKNTLPPNFHYKHNIHHQRSSSNSHHHHHHHHHQQQNQLHHHQHQPTPQQMHHYPHSNMRSFSPNISPFSGGHPLQQQQQSFLKSNQKFPPNYPMQQQQQNMNSPKMGQQFPNSMIRGPRGPSNFPLTPVPPSLPPHPMHSAHPRLRQQISPISSGAGGGHSPYALMDGNMNSPGSMIDNRRSPFMFPQQSPNMMMAKNPMMMNPYGGPHPSHMHHMANDGRHMGSMTIECNSLMLNLLLSDSMFNLFRDHNFESCAICVCNMNIKGNDFGIYLPENLVQRDHHQQQQQQNSDQYYQSCSCGFSAISNRHLSYFAGLFYEDEVEITGVYYDPIEANKENLLLPDSQKDHMNKQIEAFIDKDLTKSLIATNDEQFIQLLLNQSMTIFPSVSTLANLMYCERRQQYLHSSLNMKNKSNQMERLRNPLRLLYEDYSVIIQMSLQQARSDHSSGSNTPTAKLFQHGGWSNGCPSTPSHIGGPGFSSNRPLLHDWQFRKSNFPVNNHEVMLTLKTLQPLMQESVQRKGSSEVTYNTVKGPLTWRQFHRLAGRGTECQCEPQPIPSLMVGYDRECVALSPFGLKFWEKLSLEPYAITRDVYYVVIAPADIESQLSTVKNFFKELSATYEILRLGRHTPLGKLYNDSGIFVLNNDIGNGKFNLNNNDYQQSMDDWFQQLGDSNLARKIRSFANALLELLPSFTPTSVNDRSMKSEKSLNSHQNQHQHEMSSSSTNNGNSNHVTMNGTSSSYTSSSNTTTTTSTTSLLSSSTSSFNNNNNNPQQQKPLNNGLNNGQQQTQSDNNNNNNNANGNGNQILNDLDASHGSSNQDHNHSGSSSSNVFQPYDEEEDPHKYPSIMIYILESFSPLGKEMTRLGSIGLLKTFAMLKKYFPEQMRNNVHMQMLTIDSICSNDKDFRDYPRLSQLKELSFAVYGQCKQQLVVQSNIKSLTGLGPAASFELFLKNKASTFNRTELFTTPYILASLKDKQTELTETFGDRRERSQILYCSYCLTEDKKWLLASCTNDRGDILHTKVININIPNRMRRRKASIRRFGLDKLMRFMQTVMAESVTPWRLVIGRVGRIGHGELKDWTFLLSKKSLLKYSRQLKEMCDQCRYVGPNDQPAIYSACLISLEADTALRVFPNYYTPDERFSSSCNTCGLSTPEDASCTHILVFPTSATTQSSHTNFNLNDEFFSNLDDNNLESDIPVEDDLFDFLLPDDFLLQPRDGLQPDSPNNRQMFDTSNSLKNSSLMDVDQDEPAQLSQQPLALAFYVSTARTGPLPRWFWAHCPHLEIQCPVFLKSALLIHTPSVQQNTDDILQSNNRDGHSLDSNLTTDVLRYSLEGYNALSWLILDPLTNDRLSCLPVHIQVLMQLYHTIQALHVQ
ncbi:mediator complex subunit skuld [Dermatophagoides pteronyssinus]|uniref:mediator complex subunit skuld n=1 Tax=Dermatophagoides pteronyssinus TaxID=6956 RepID=UPI003F66F6C1